MKPNLQLPSPTNWQDFELLCCDLWREVWGDPNTKRNGRSGQEQNGVDVYGRPGCGKSWAGVQCKGKDNFSKKNLTKREVQSEVEKAKGFQPRLTEFIIATTGLKDAKIEQFARQLSDRNLENGLFSVDVWSWQDIRERLWDFPSVLKSHYSGIVDYDSLEELKDKSRALLESQADIKNDVSSLVRTSLTFPSDVFGIYTGPSIREGILTAEYQAELDHARSLIQTHHYRYALKLLEDLKARAWHTAPPIVRFRLLSNIGAALAGLGREDEAASLFVEALQYNPEDEGALANTTLGYCLMGEQGKAMESCQALLKKNPMSARAYGLLVDILSASSTIDEVVERVPVALRNCPEVAYGLSRWAYNNRDLPRAKQFMEAAVEHDKENSPELKALLGSLILESIMKDEAVVVQAQLPGKHRKDVERAMDLASEAWNIARDTDLRSIRANWVANRGWAKRLLGDIDGAIADTDAALEIEPDNAFFRRNRAALCELCGTTQERLRAIDLLKSIQSDARTPEASLLLAQLLLEDKRALEAKKTLDDMLARQPTTALLEEARRLLAQVWLDIDTDRARQSAEELATGEPRDLLDLATAARVHRILGDSGAALALIKSAEAQASETTPYIVLMNLANELFLAGETDTAAKVFERITDTSVDSQLTKRLLKCYYELGKLDRVLEISGELHQQYGPLLFTSELQSFIYDEIGDLPMAEQVCREYLAVHPGDFSMKLRLAVICLRTSAYEELDQFLGSPVDPGSLTPEMGLLLGQLYSSRNLDQKWFRLMYELRRRFFASARVHLYYVLGFFRKNRDEHDWLRPNSVAVDSAVEVTKPSGRKEWYIIEDREEPDYARQELAVSHPLAQRLLGRRVGDVVELKANAWAKDEGQITEIKSKYIHALHQTMQSYEARFPDSSGLWSVPVSSNRAVGGAADGFQAILDEVARQQERNAEAQRLYQRGELTLGSISSATGRDIFKVWRTFISSEVGVICCAGDPEERTQAVGLLQPEGTKLVGDAISLFTLHSLGIADAVVKGFGKIGIAQPTMEELRRVAEGWATFRKRGFMLLGKEGEQFVRTEVTAEDVERLIDQLSAMSEWVEKGTEVIPCEALLTLERGRRQQLGEILGEGSFQTILIASRSGRLLLSDDERFRRFARHEFQVNGVWTQALLMRLQSQGIIDKERFSDSTVKLAGLNYHFTSIDADALLMGANLSDWAAKPPYTDLLKTMSRAKSDHASTLGLTAEFIDKVCTRLILPHGWDALVFALLDVVTEARNRTQFIDELIRLLKVRLAYLPIEHQRAVQAVGTWVHSHRIWP